MSKYSSLLWVAALMSVSALASAETLSSPGTNCVVADGSIPGTVYWDGEYANPSTSSTVWLNCPVATNASAPTITQARVTFLDRHTSQNASCRINAQFIDAAGTVFFWESAAMTSVGFGSGPQTLSTSVGFGGLGNNVGFQCSLPPKTASGVSSLFRYEITR